MLLNTNMGKGGCEDGVGNCFWEEVVPSKGDGDER